MIGARSTTGSQAVDPLASLVHIDGVAAAVAASRTAVDRLREHRVMRRRGEVVSRESLLRGAVAAAALETGADLSPTADQDLLTTEEPDPAGGAPSTTHAQAVRGAGRAYGDLATLRHTWTHSPLQVLARLHLLTARELVDNERLGRPRVAGDLVREGPYDAMLGAAPGPLEVHDRLDALVSVLAATRAPALVVAAVVHGEIATLRPFVWGNQVVALAAQRLVLVELGLDPRSQAVVEVGHLDAGEATSYGEALAAYGTGGPDGVAAWVRHCGAAVRAGATEGIAICEALGR